MRIVTRSGRHGQDEIVRDVVAAFDGCPRPSKVIDRRTSPVHGYRAVHVIVFPEGVPVEIQVRTRWQHEWAELFEKLADRIGRGIRYGEPPARWWAEAEFDSMDPVMKQLVLSEYEMRSIIVDLALAVAGMIDALEIGEASAPSDPELDVWRRSVEAELVELRKHLDKL